VTLLGQVLALVDDRTLVSAMGRVHDFGDRRLRLPGIAGLVNARLKVPLNVERFRLTPGSFSRDGTASLTPGPDCKC